MNPFADALKKVNSEEATPLVPAEPKEDEAKPTRSFDYNFDLHAAKEDPTLRVLKITQGELDAMLAEAEARGHQQGLIEGQTNHEAVARDRLNQEVSQIYSKLEEGMTQALLEVNTNAADAAELGLTVGRTLAAHLIARHPEAEIMGLMEDSLEHLRTVPHIILRVSPDLCDAIQPLVDALSAKYNLAHPPMIMPDRDVGWGNCQLDWSNGSILRDHDASLSHIEETVQRFIEDKTGSISTASLLTEKSEDYHITTLGDDASNQSETNL